MKKFIFVLFVLLVLTIIPGSLTSSEVHAQNPTSANGCVYADLLYSHGAFVTVELDDTQYLLLQCQTNYWVAKSLDDVMTIGRPASN